ncbi:MAG: glycosyltransferase family 39 protein [Anaerolineae bacterium]
MRSAVLIFAVLAGFALRAYRLGAQSLWSDEDITLDRAGQALSQLIAGLPVEHAPLYFVLVRLWSLVAGAGDTALRFPSLAFGVLAVPLGAYVGRRLVGPKTALVAGAVLAVSPFLVWYGQEARMYTLVAALSLASVSAVLRAEQTGRRAWWGAAGALAALCVYAHYYGVLLIAVLVAWAVLDALSRRDGALTDWLLAGATALALFAPWLPRAVRLAEFPGWRAPEPVSHLLGSAVYDWTAGVTAAPGVGTWSVVLYLALAAVGLAALLARAARGGDERIGALRLLAYLAVPSAVILALLLHRPDFHPRYFFAALPAAYLVTAVGASALPRPLPLVAAGLLVLGAVPPLARLYTDPSAQKQDYRAVIAIVESAAGDREGLDRSGLGPGDEDAEEFGDTTLLLDGPPFGMMERYRSPESPVRIINLNRTAVLDLPPAERDAEIARRAASYPHVWLATDGQASGVVAAWLDAHAFPVDQLAVQQLTLARYYNPAPSEDWVAGNLQGLPIAASIEVPLTVAAGGVLPVALTWHPEDADGAFLADGELKVAVRLVDAADESVVARADRRPANWTRPTGSWLPGDAVLDRHGLLVAPDVPPGEYDLVVVLYREADPTRSWEERLPEPIAVRGATSASAVRPAVEMAAHRKSQPIARPALELAAHGTYRPVAHGRYRPVAHGRYRPVAHGRYRPVALRAPEPIGLRAALP